MIDRCLPLLVTALLGTSVAGAQTYVGEGPPLYEPFAEFSPFRPANFGGLVLIEGLAARREAAGTYYLIVAGRRSFTLQPRLSAWRWNSTTMTLTRLTDVDAFTLDGDIAVSLSHDLLDIIVFRNGGGVEASSRAAPNLPFGARRAVTGLLPNSYAVTLGQVDEMLLGTTTVVFAATPSPTSEIHMYGYDRITAQAIRRRLIGSRQLSGNRYELITPLEDELGNTKKLLVARGQDLSDLQQFGCISGVDGRSPVKWSFDAPRRNKCLSCVHWGGGEFRASILGHPIGEFPQHTTVKCKTLATCNEKLDGAGGRARFRLWSPGAITRLVPTQGTILLGAPGAQAIPLPGIGNLGLNPSLMIPLPVQDTSSGETSWDLNYPPLAPGVFFWTQGVDVGDRITLSNTAEARQ